MSKMKFDVKDLQSIKTFAKYIAIVIRNAMEDFHHANLSDEQMKTLNPIVRNAIYTALYAFVNQNESSKSRRFIQYQLEMIPIYWEDPELLTDFKT